VGGRRNDNFMKFKNINLIYIPIGVFYIIYTFIAILNQNSFFDKIESNRFFHLADSVDLFYKKSQNRYFHVPLLTIHTIAILADEYIKKNTKK
jgi:hypothetical protein